MDGKEIAGLTIASFSSLTGIILWYLYSSNKLGKEWKDNAPMVIFFLLLFSIIAFIIFYVERNDNSKPDKILHLSLTPYYLSCLIVIIGICLTILTVLGNGKSHRIPSSVF
jgi:hypothetical protein